LPLTNPLILRNLSLPKARHDALLPWTFDFECVKKNGTAVKEFVN